MNTPTVSVIVPCYNVERYVRQAIASVVGQRLPVHEIIVVDDGSTDGTASEVDAFRDVATVRVHRTENRGLGPARNFGLELATGDYVYFLDSDDVMADSFSEVLHQALGDGNAPDLVCFSGTNFLDDGFESLIGTRYTAAEFLRRKDKLMLRRIAGRFHDGSSAALALIRANSFFPNAYLYVSRRSLWLSHGLRFKPILHEDVEVVIPLFAAAREVEVLSAIVYQRRIRASSIMTSGVSARSLAAREQILRSLLAYRVESGRRGEVLRQVIKHVLTRTCIRYFSAAGKLHLPVDLALSLRAVARLGDARLVARLVRLLVRSAAWRIGPAKAPE